MEIEFRRSGVVEIRDAKIIKRNFAGRPGDFNKEGERQFLLLIPDQDIAQALLNDVNEFGVGWNVKIKPPRDEDDSPFVYLLVKVKFNQYGPAIHLKSGDAINRIDEDSAHILDEIYATRIDLDIRPYDGESRFGPHRTAYLQSMYITQGVDRFMDRFADEECPEE